MKMLLVILSLTLTLVSNQNIVCASDPVNEAIDKNSKLNTSSTSCTFENFMNKFSKLGSSGDWDTHETAALGRLIDALEDEFTVSSPKDMLSMTDGMKE